MTRLAAVPRASHAAGVLALASLATLVALVVAPWLHPRFDWEGAADAPNHLIRLYAIAHALSHGSLYPRWLPDLYLGYGYPLLNYYAPASYYLGAALHALGLSIFAAFQWTGVLAVVLGGSGTFLLTRALTSGPLVGSLLAAAIYLCSPYPFITNLIVRAAVPEALALGLLPWLLLATRHAVLTPGRRAVVPLAAAITALVLSHNVSALILLPIAITFGVLLTTLPGLTRRGRGRASIAAVGLGIAVGLAVSAFFWLPALLESRYVQLDLLSGGIYDFHTWLFDPLRAGPAQPSIVFDYTALGRAVPQHLSPWQIALWLVATISCLAHRRHPPAQVGLAASLFAFGGWFLTTTWSAPLWNLIPLLDRIQFPWRLHGPLSLAIALAVACSLRRGRWTLSAALILTVCLAAGSLLSRPPNLSPTEPTFDVNAEFLASKEVNRYGMGTTSGGEFLPRSVGWPVEGSIRRGIRLYEDAYPQSSWQAGHARILDGRAAITQVHRDLSGIAVTVTADTPAQLAFHQLAFPGWRAYLNGAPAPLSVARYEPFNASLGFSVLAIPPGTHRAEIRFGPTRLRHAANALSAASVVIAMFALSAFSHRPTRLPLGSLPRSLLLGALPAAAAVAAITLGEAHARPGATVRPTTAHVLLDVITSLQSGHAQARTPSGSGAGLFPPYLERQFKVVRGEERRWLYMHPPSEIAVRLRVPPHAYFQAGLALDPPTWYEAVGDGARFIVEVDTGSARHPLLDRHLHPRGRSEEQAWNDVWVSLEAYVNQEVTLRLRTEHGVDPNFDWAGWSNPQVVTYHTSRPHPGAPHKW